MSGNYFMVFFRDCPVLPAACSMFFGVASPESVFLTAGFFGITFLESIFGGVSVSGAACTASAGVNSNNSIKSFLHISLPMDN